MEKSKKHVDRQATFDTDAKTKKGNLKLPVIDSKEELVKEASANKQTVKNKSPNNTVSVKTKQQQNNSTDTPTQNKVSAQKALKQEKNHTVNDSKDNNKTGKSNLTTASNSVKSGSTNNNVQKSTSLSKSLEAKLAKKEPQSDPPTHSKQTRKDDKLDTPRQSKGNSKVTNNDLKSPYKDEKVLKTSVLSNINRNRSKSPTKRNPSPEKVPQEKYKSANNSQTNDKHTNNTVKNNSSVVPKITTSSDPDSKGQIKGNAKHGQGAGSGLSPSNTKEPISPRRVKNNSKSYSEKGDERFVSGSAAPDETNLKRTSTLQNTSDAKRSSKSETQNNRQNPEHLGNKVNVVPSLQSQQFKYNKSPINSSERDNKFELDTINDASLSLTDNQKQTYVLSPASTKLGTKSTPSGISGRSGRLSPTSEVVESGTLDSIKTNMAGRESYEQIHAERATLLKAETAYRKRIKQLEDEANGFLKAIEDLTNENRCLRDKVDDGEMRVEGRGERFDNEKLGLLETENLKLTKRVKELERELNVGTNEEDIRKLKTQVVKLQSDMHQVNKENDELKSENNENVRKLKALELEKKNLEKSVNSVDVEKLSQIEDLNSEQKELTKQLKEYKSKTKELEKKVDALEYENKTLSETLTQKKSELNEVLGVMKDESKFDDEIKDLKNQILKLNKEKKDLELAKNREKRIISEKLDETKSSLVKVNGELDELKIKYDQAEKEKKRFKSELTPMKKKCDDLEGEVTRLKEEVVSLQKQLKDSNQKYAKLLSDTENAAGDLKNTKEQFEQLNKDLQTVVNDKESQISKLINQLDSMRKERDTDRNTIKEEKEKIIQETQKIEIYQATNKRLENELKHLSEQLDESRLNEKQLALQLEDKNFHMSNLEQQVFEMNMKLDNNSKRMNDLDREKREMQQDKREWDVKKDKIDDIEASNKRLLEENKRLRNQLETTSYLSTQSRPTDRISDNNDIVEAWVHEKTPNNGQAAIYVTKEKDRKRVHIVQPESQKKRQPFTKSSPTKNPRQPSNRKTESKSKSPSRSLEDIRKVADIRTPESEHSLPELSRDARLTVGYGTFAGYREIHKDRITAARKRVY